MSGDLLAVIEAAYAAEPSDERWLAGLARAVAPVLDDGLGVFGHTYALRADGSVVLGAMQTDTGPVSADLLRRVQQLADSIPLRGRLYTRAPVAGSASQLTGQAAWKHPDVYEGSSDALGIVGGNPSGHGVVVHGSRKTPTHLGQGELRLWTRVAAHIASGYRLRLREPSTDAVLTPNGRVAHAEGAASGAAERSALGEAARAMDRARGKMRRADPDEALGLWRALVAGEWSLVEQIESDGRRYIFARRNAPEVRAWRELTDRERQVLAYAAEGQSHKLIGYELGIAASTVASHLGNAGTKLGVRSRLELVRAYKRAQGATMGVASRRDDESAPLPEGTERQRSG